MKRSGFTMIELIFVIVILGILASVALPKLIGVKEQADEGVVKSLVGTLNRTVAPAKWSKSISDDMNGSINTAAYDINTSDTDIPATFTGTDVNTTNCVTPGTAAYASHDAIVTKDGKFGIVCRDGNSSNSPKFWYYDKTVHTTQAPDFNDSQTVKLP